MNERVELQAVDKAAGFKAAFAEHLGRLTNDALRDYQARQFAHFSERGLPSRREEAWKYTDLTFLEKKAYALSTISAEAAILDAALLERRAQDNHLLVFINGHFSPSLSSLGQLPEGMLVSSLQEALQKHKALVAPYLLREIDAKLYPLASLNASLSAEGAFVYLPAQVKLEKPLHLLSIATEKQSFMSQPRHLLVLEQGAALKLTEEYRTEGAEDYLNNNLVDCYLGREAELHYNKLQLEAAQAKHFSTLFLHLKERSRVRGAFFALGAAFARQDVYVDLQEAYAACQLKGFYGLDKNQQLIDHHLFIHHRAKHTESELDFRGVVAKQARAVFNGRVKVEPGAQGAKAEQGNHNLLLSPLGEVDSKPDLEIYADDIQCRHGATVGQLDEETLFYLCARGVDRTAATVLLLQALMENALALISLPSLAAEVKAFWGARVEELS